MCSQCDAQRFLDNVEKMINDDNHRFSWAFDTLDGILETVEHTGHVTFKQSAAVDRIANSVRRKR